MTRFPLRIAPALLVTSLLLGGCASRSLVTPPPVVDWSTGSQPALPAVAPAQTYTVRRDDTLSSIARRFGTTPADLAAWNNLGSNPRVRVDQVLRVSPPAPSGAEMSAPVATTQPIGTETVEQRPLGAEPGRPLPPVPSPASGSNAPVKSGPLGIKRPYSDAALAELSRPDSDATGATAPPATPVTASPAIPATSASSTTLAWSWPATGKPGNGFAVPTYFFIANMAVLLGAGLYRMAIGHLPAQSTFHKGMLSYGKPGNGFADGKSKGIDIPGKAGDAVLAAADGKVTFSGTGVRGYGNFVIIRHSPELLSVYAHNRVNLVKEGAVVTKGQKIAEMGNSDTDAVKLHFEIRNDSKPVDPMKYLPER